MAKIVIDTCYCIYLLEAPEEIVQHISEYIQKYILNGEGLGDGHQYLNKDTQEMTYEVEGFVEFLNNEYLKSSEEKVCILEQSVDGKGYKNYPMAFLD